MESDWLIGEFPVPHKTTEYCKSLYSMVKGALSDALFRLFGALFSSIDAQVLREEMRSSMQGSHLTGC